MAVVMHYAGEKFEIDDGAMSVIQALSKEAVTAGEARWHELTTNLGVARFLFGPGIPMAFTTIHNNIRFW